ncbi:MAG: Gfo/Idh/MocA family oxidoreductase [Lachnospiraceae bacterium]|nr:Gfo/Idh/MocA family oxidoreductase [Lachnospiraceae bacterium]
MSKVLNVGMVGFGYMGRMHAMAYDNIRYYYNTDVRVKLYAVADVVRPVGAPVDFEKYYTSAEEMLEDDNIDIIDICAPNFVHKEALVKAIAKHKPIYCEKPLTTDLATAEEVMRTIEETQYHEVNRVTFEYRFVPAIIRAKQIIDEGGIGDIINFNFKYYGCEFLDPNRPISWQSTKAMSGGGVLYAMGTHALDMIRYLIGEVDDVFAQQKTYFKKRPLRDNPAEMKDVEIEDLINVQFNCKNGAMGTLLLSQVAAGSGVDLTFEVYGTKGAVKFDHTNANVIYYYNNEDPKEPTGGYGGFKAIETTQKYGGEAVFPPPRVTIAWSRYHIASLYDFVSAVAAGRDTHPNFEDGFRVQQLTDAIYRSAETGRIVKL